jgi:hypothetical protein
MMNSRALPFAYGPARSIHPARAGETALTDRTAIMEGLLRTFRAQRCFDALHQPLPPARVGRSVGEGEATENRQVALHRRRQRRFRHAGQPCILGLHGRIEHARPRRP